MRRLIVLTTTLGLRTTLTIVTGVWVYFQMHTVHANGYWLSTTVNHRGYDAMWMRNPLFMQLNAHWSGSTLNELSPAVDLSFKCTIKKSHINVSISHEFALVSLLIANILHWLYHRRRRRAVLCDD